MTAARTSRRRWVLVGEWTQAGHGQAGFPPDGRWRYLLRRLTRRYGRVVPAYWRLYAVPVA